MFAAQIYPVYVVIDDYGYVYNNAFEEQLYVSSYSIVAVTNFTAPRVLAVNVNNTNGKGVL